METSRASSAPKGQDEIAQGNALGASFTINRRSPERAKPGSIPDITFIELNTVFIQQASVFLLKGDLAMMLSLLGDILLQSGAVGGTHREDSITALPMKIGISHRLGLQPFRGARFDLLNQIGRRTGARVNQKQMNVVGNRARPDQGCLGDSR